MTDTSTIDTELDEFPLPVESSKVREFAIALLDDDPIYQDVDAARAAGFEDIPAPLTFAAASSHFRDDLSLFERLGMDLRRVLHGESSWEYLAPVTVRERLLAHRRLADVATRSGNRGGDMTLYTFETEFVNDRGHTVLRQRDVVIETGGTK
jgi:N-terminal half of MaoC dehydratase